MLCLTEIKVSRNESPIAWITSLPAGATGEATRSAAEGTNNSGSVLILLDPNQTKI